MDYGKVLLKPSPDEKFFWDHCKEHKLTFQKCQDCGYIRWPASIICPRCHSYYTELIVSSGKGKIYSFVVYHRAFLEAVEGDVPYVVGVVELDEGPRLISSIVDCCPNKVRCDMPVVVTWEDVNEGLSVPKFKPE